MQLKMIACLLFATITCSITRAQKAYDAVCYQGSVQNITIRFTLGNGYIGASEIRTTDNTTKKTSRFLPESGVPEENHTMKFYHFSAGGKTFSDYFILEGMKELYDRAPAVIHGIYYFNNHSWPFALRNNMCIVR